MESICRLYLYYTDGQFGMTDVEGSVEYNSEGIQVVEVSSAEDRSVMESLNEGSAITCRTVTDEYVSGSINEISLMKTEVTQIVCNSVDLGKIRPVPFTQQSLQL